MATARAMTLSYLIRHPENGGEIMHKLLTLAGACILTAAMAFAQGAASQQAPPPSGTQSSGSTVNATPNSNSTSPSAQNGATRSTPSRSNQALPGRSNPANSATQNGSANGQAVNPNQSGAATTGNPGDNSDNNGMAKDDTGNNPASGRGSNTITNPGTSGTVQWFWIALAIIVGVILLGVLFSRNRARGNIDNNDPALKATDSNRREFQRGPQNDARKDDERIRRVG
jgi:hypothetical protein